MDFLKLFLFNKNKCFSIHVAHNLPLIDGRLATRARAPTNSAPIGTAIMTH